MATTYRRTQPVHQPLMKDTFYSDYDVESGISKRVNCLVALTVLALIIGGAALGISLMLLMQSMDGTARKAADVALLQQRLKHLERQLGIPDPTLDVLEAAPPKWEGEEPLHKMGPPADEGPPNEMGPPAGEEPPMTAGQPHHDLDDDEHHHVEEELSSAPDAITPGEGGGGAGATDEDHHIHLTHSETSDGDSYDHESDEDTLVLPHHPDDDGDDDDDDGFGSGDCPVLPRPVCPIDMIICHTREDCPVPVCCPRQ